MLDQDGQVLWRLPYQPLFSQGGGDSDHVDEAEIGDVDGDGRLEIFYASGTLLDAETGRPHFSRLAGVTNGQWVRIDKVRDDLPGRQLLLAKKWSPPVLFDVRGAKLDWPFPFASWDLLDWNGDGETEVMGGGLICDRRGIVVGVCEPSWTMPQYGDVTGNGRQEGQEQGQERCVQIIASSCSVRRRRIHVVRCRMLAEVIRNCSRATSQV